MSTYALIHGAHHGAWCWDYLIPELEARGHSSIAVNLPAEDPGAGVSRCADLVVGALAGVGDDLVVIGHSLGGLTAPVVAMQRRVRRLVFLAAVVPHPGRSFAEQQEIEPDMAFESIRIDNGDGTWSRPADEAERIYYHDCGEERRQFAVSRLRRQSAAPHVERSPLAELPDVPTTYIVCNDDRALRPSWQRQVARRRLGIEPLGMPGSHSPFLAQPDALAEILSSLS